MGRPAVQVTTAEVRGPVTGLGVVRMALRELGWFSDDPDEQR